MKSSPILPIVVTAVVLTVFPHCAALGFAQNEAKKEPGQTVEKPELSDSNHDSLARATLKKAREKFYDYKSVQAKILETVVLGPRKFKATGNYLQGTDLKLRLDYKVQVGETIGSFLQVCDGDVLWTRHQIVRAGKNAQTGQNAANSRITRRNVKDILNAAAASGNMRENILTAELGLGGLPALLASLERSMIFDRQYETSIGDVTVTVIEGTWNDDLSKKWLTLSPVATTKDDAKEPAQLPVYVPDRVRVYFDQNNLFPRRVLYLKKLANQKDYRSMVALDFRDVVLNAQINKDEFNYVPPDGVRQTDVTKLYLQRLAPAQTQTAKPGQQGDTPTTQQTTPANKDSKRQ